MPNTRVTSHNRESASRKLAKVQQQQAAARRRRRVGVGTGVAIVAIVVALVVARVAVGHSNGPAAVRTDGAGVAAQVAAVPSKAIDAVGAGTGVTPPTPLSTAALTSAGKPEVLYVGAEYCPYCAAERWAVVQAMSRFGTFTGLGQTASAPDDVYPSTATLSFHGATYSSSYLSFQGFETESNVRQGNGYAPLDTVPADLQAVVAANNPDGTIPFVDLGGKALISGASYSPQVLAGLTQAQIAADLSQPTTAVAKAVLGAANSVTKRLCTLTGNLPAAACTASGVTAAA